MEYSAQLEIKTKELDTVRALMIENQDTQSASPAPRSPRFTRAQEKKTDRVRAHWPPTLPPTTASAREHQRKPRARVCRISRWGERGCVSAAAAVCARGPTVPGVPAL